MGGGSGVGRPRASGERPVVFGVDLGWLSPSALFLVLCVGTVGSATVFSALQEKVFLVPGFKYGGFMTVVMTGCYVGYASLERVATGEGPRRGLVSNYALLAMLTSGGLYTTNVALRYVNYPTRLVFKASKLLPTMLVGTLLQGKRYGVLEYAAAATLMVGMSLFSLGDVDTPPTAGIFGIFLLLVALVFDALTSNFEERYFFRTATPSSQAEVMQWSSIFGTLFALLPTAASGELGPALEHARQHPEVITTIAVFSGAGYVSVVLVLLLIKHFSASDAEIVKGTRKVLQIAVSFYLYPKPLNWRYTAGGGMVLASLFALAKLRGSSSSERRTTKGKYQSSSRTSSSMPSQSSPSVTPVSPLVAVASAFPGSSAGHWHARPEPEHAGLRGCLSEAAPCPELGVDLTDLFAGKSGRRSGSGGSPALPASAGLSAAGIASGARCPGAGGSNASGVPHFFALSRAGR